VLALAQDGEPGETRLEALEAELLEQAAVVAHREAPLAVVVGAVGRIGAAPGAARDAVLAPEHAAGKSRAHAAAR
jgi:hypothetical protein